MGFLLGPKSGYKIKIEKFENNGRQEQNDNKIEEIVQLPNVAQTLYTVISGKKEERNMQDREN